MSDEIISPNAWITRAGGHLTKEDIVALPIKVIIMPMHNASTSIERYEREKHKPQTMDLVGKMQLIQNIGLNVRTADKAYFNEWSKALIAKNINEPNVINLFGGCKNCLQSSLSPNSLREFVSPKLKELSDQNNVKIIHAMDSGGMIQESDANIVFEYYNEFLSLNLMYFPEIKSLPIKRCKQCSS